LSKLKGLTIDFAPIALFYIDFSGKFLDCNNLAEKLSGYEKGELHGKGVDLIFPCFTKILADHKCDNAKPIDILLQSEVQLITKLAENIHCSMSCNKVVDGYVFTISKQAIQTAPNALKGAHKVLNGIEEAFWEWNIEKNVIYYSAQLMSILGHKAEPYTGPITFWEEHVSEHDLKKIYRQIDEHIAGNVSSINPTYSITTKNGEKKWVTLIGKIFEYKEDRPYKMFGSIQDVSENHLLVKRLEKQNNYLILAEKLGNSGHWHFNIKEQELYWSNGVFAIHGVKPSTYQPTFESAVDFFLPEEQAKFRKCIEQAITKKQSFHFKSTIKHVLGKKVKVELLGKVEVNRKEDVVGVFGVFRDITKSEEVFNKLKLLAMVNYTIKVPIFFIDDQDNVVYQDLSPQMGNKNSVLFNYVNFSISEYLDFKRIAKEQGQIKKTDISFDKFNSVFDLSVTYESDAGIYIWIVENVTEKFRKDQQQIISNRLALLGNTFGNVSHDINNVLGVALGATEMLEIKFSSGSKDISKYIERVKNAIDKGKDVTERLLAFTRKPTVKIIKFDPMKEIEANKYLFKQLLLSTIDFQLHTENIHCEITFPQGEFINILLNLVLNSQDAIREQELIGKIKISANIVNNEKLEIHIEDSGIGIKQENLSKIFDPFYSSKSVNKGNGIGLANVYSTIYKHNGAIQVEGHSKELGGAHFTLIFNCDVTTSVPVKKIEKKSQLSLVGQNVLILDDEESIAEFVSLYLDSEGVKTQHAVNKPGLIEKIQKNEHFDVFITDMILPDISGRQAVELVKEKFPNIRIFSMSGYIAEEDNEWLYPVLRKPFNSQELTDFLIKYK
jgi:PAS domain S-box-containing protein